jgi:hypothetical protein
MQYFFSYSKFDFLRIFGRWFIWIGAAMVFGLTIFLKSPFMLLIAILALQDINMKVSLRFELACVFMLLMMNMILAGISEQGIFIDLLDVFLGSLFIFGYYRDHHAVAEVEMMIFKSGLNTEAILSPEVVEEVVSTKSRFKWLACYLGLGIILIMALAMELPHLPSHLGK